MVIKSKSKSFLDVCYTLRTNLHLFTKNNNTLLPERDLCTKLSTSRATLRKALDELRSQTVIQTEGRRNYVNTSEENFDIGLLVDCYKPAPYMDNQAMIGIMQKIEAEGCNARILIPGDIDSIPDLVKLYNLKGLVWLNPPNTALGKIAEMSQKIKLTCIITLFNFPNDSPLKYNYLTFDLASYGKEIAESFKRKGHKRILYLGSADTTYSSFKKEMEVDGFEQAEKWILDRPSKVNKSLIKLIKKNKINGIFSNGRMVNSLFHSLGKSSGIDLSKLCIQVPYLFSTFELMKQYPEVKISKLEKVDQMELGSKSIEMLLQQIKNNVPQKPIFIKPKLFNADGLQKYVYDKDL